MRLKKSEQRWLFLCIKKIYSNIYLILEDYVSSSHTFENSGIGIEIDIFIPALNLGLEYNGEQHYDDIPGSFSYIELYKDRDIEKKDICGNSEINLKLIPYWWDKNIDSLRSFIQ